MTQANKDGETTRIDLFLKKSLGDRIKVEADKLDISRPDIIRLALADRFKD